MNQKTATEVYVRIAEGGVIVSPHARSAIVVAEETVFTDPERFANYMRAWFEAHHGEVPVMRMPARGFAQNGEG